MPRRAMVTRTIETTKVLALCVDLTTETPYKAEFILSGTFEEEKNIMKALKKVADDDVHKVVSVISTEVLETLYGMDEQDFIANAKVLPPRKTQE